jgi:hypothetical protein
VIHIDTSKIQMIACDPFFRWPSPDPCCLFLEGHHSKNLREDREEAGRFCSNLFSLQISMSNVNEGADASRGDRMQLGLPWLQPLQ